MNWETGIALLLLVLILGGAALYLLRAKKRGNKCIGCPHSATCPNRENNAKCKTQK